MQLHVRRGLAKNSHIKRAGMILHELGQAVFWCAVRPRRVKLIGREDRRRIRMAHGSIGWDICRYGDAQ
jgi:hypothetical protein